MLSIANHPYFVKALARRGDTFETFRRLRRIRARLFRLGFAASPVPEVPLRQSLPADPPSPGGPRNHWFFALVGVLLFAVCIATAVLTAPYVEGLAQALTYIFCAGAGFLTLLGILQIFNRSKTSKHGS